MIIYLDTETTGLHPGNICQLSYIIQTKENQYAKNFFFTVDNVEYGAFMVHGFSVEKLLKLSNGKRFNYYAEEIYNDLKTADLVIAHNTAFDFMFLSKEYENLGCLFNIDNSFCSMKKTTAICKLSRPNGKGYKYPKLNELCTFLGVSDAEILSESKRLFKEKTAYHDARFDATAVYLAVNRGIEKYSELKEIKDYL